MVFGMIPLVVIALLVDERPIVWSGYFIGALIYNGVGGMAIATLLWLYILQRLPATISGLNALAVPIVGVIAAWIQLGERPSLGGGLRDAVDSRRARVAHEHAAQRSTLKKSAGNSEEIARAVRY